MNARAIEKEALELPVARRARLAQKLLESLDALSAVEADALWLQTAARRARDIDAGAVRLVEPEQLERRIRARLK
ncbi:MAG: addiction module protein [Proteobacteria bacterium]|nr:addiction module protein [Pseudomonadota bacterium]